MGQIASLHQIVKGFDVVVFKAGHLELWVGLEIPRGRLNLLWFFGVVFRPLQVTTLL